MSKNKSFFGTDSYGVNIEVSIRKEDNQFFWRSYSYNGFGSGWSKWEKMDGSEIEVVDGKEYLKWGWNKLQSFSSNSRLPKLKKNV